MADNPWLSIDTATLPAERARELRQAWERFVVEGDVGAIRMPIAHSWQRSHAAGVDPSASRVAPVITDGEEASARWDVHPLAAVAPLIRGCLGPVAEASEHLIVVSDASGLLLWVEGRPRTRLDAADAMNFTEGAAWGERDAGTNAVGTALAVDHAVQVFAAEHFNEVVQQWTCAAAPVHDPDTDTQLGVIDLTGRMGTVHPHSLACAMATAQAVEAHLRIAMAERDNRLRSQHADRLAAGGRRALVTPTGRVIAGDADGWTGAARLILPAGGGELVLPSGVPAFAEPVGRDGAFVVRPRDVPHAAARGPVLKLCMLGRDRADVTLDGRPVRLGRRQAEMLALLTTHRDGMATEQLAADLYGDAGQPVTVRVQMHRLRKVLGRYIDTDPYRLAVDVESDVARIAGLLARGAVREAAEAYGGPLLPHSEAPGVVREREELDRWLRQAVMSAEDDDALWAWVQSPSGDDDLPAWKRLLGRLAFEDPRRSLAAAHLGTLRRLYN